MVELQPLQAEFVQNHPDIPVLPKTLLLLELMVQEPCVDLREISQLVLSDLGATLQIMRQISLEYRNAEDRPTRIEDCISALGLEVCLKAVSAQSISQNGRKYAIAEFWDHCGEIAQLSRMVAEEMLDGYPEEAYMAGLFHAMGLLPELLGWKEPSGTDAALIGLRLATGWSLPHSVTEFFREIHFPGYPALWSVIVREAHQRANRSSIDCPFELGLRPHLVWNGYEQLGQVNYR